jgi:Carboxypeptidase regulatory-like domain
VKLTGTALDADGRPIRGAMVNVVHLGAGSTFVSIGAPIGADGKFTLTGLTPGDYVLRMFGQGVPDASSLPITVGGSDISDVQLVAAKPSTIRGRIVFTDSVTAAEPPKATAITLGAVRDWAGGQPTRSAAKIAEDGTFEISVQASHVVLRAVVNTAPTPPPTRGPLPPNWRLNRVVAGDIDVGDSGIDVPANGAVENVIVEMTNRSNELSGRITDADGNIVRDCFVIVFAQDPAKWTVQTRYLSAVRPALDDEFHARVLPGDYYAVAMSDVEVNAWTDPEFLSLARERAVKFSIADGEKKSIDLQVILAPVY